MPSREYPVAWVMAQRNMLPVGIEPGTSQPEVGLTNHLAGRTGTGTTLPKNLRLQVCYGAGVHAIDSAWPLFPRPAQRISGHPHG